MRIPRSASAAALAAALLPASPAPLGEPAAGKRAAGTVTAERPLRIHVRPPRVYPGSLATLEVQEGGARLAEGSVRWSVGGGSLHSDDLPRVDWRVPRTAGGCRVRAECSVGGRTVEVARTLEVERPSTDGMVWIPAGTFLRGDRAGTADPREVKTIQNSGDEPDHAVHVEGYWIDRHPVTNLGFARFLGECLQEEAARVGETAVWGQFEGSEVPFYYFQSYERLIPDYFETRNARHPRFLHQIRHDGSVFRIAKGKESCPVVDVTWFGAAAYASWYGKSLPTEAQWEKGARGTDGRRFPWGDHVPTAYHLNLEGRQGKEPLPVGSFSPTADSPYGVADMVSGIFEWTDDWFDPHYYSDNYSDRLARAVWENPTGPFWGRSHSIRGFPGALYRTQASLESTEPVSFRYSWRFEFLLGDAFANAETGFRTVIDGTEERP